jgi:membrane dipeptidase
VSHISDPGFWDVAQLAEAAGKPFFASHSNSRKVWHHSRNLTDEQFLELTRLGGVAGLNTCYEFLGPGEGCIDDAVAHIEHFCSLGGEKSVAIGGDWDGCTPFRGMDRVTDMDKLYERLLQRNFKEALVEDIFYNNLI